MENSTNNNEKKIGYVVWPITIAAVLYIVFSVYAEHHKHYGNQNTGESPIEAYKRGLKDGRDTISCVLADPDWLESTNVSERLQVEENCFNKVTSDK